MTRQQNTGLFIAGLAAIILYYLSKSGLLHESVSSSIITPQGTIVPDPITGAPQYDGSNPATIPDGVGSGVPPIDAQTGLATSNPADPTKCTCPIGFTLWHNISPDSYWCLPNAITQPATPTLPGSAPVPSNLFVSGTGDLPVSPRFLGLPATKSIYIA